jgi:hypothetical protein
MLKNGNMNFFIPIRRKSAPGGFRKPGKERGLRGEVVGKAFGGIYFTHNYLRCRLLLCGLRQSRKFL